MKCAPSRRRASGRFVEMGPRGQKDDLYLEDVTYRTVCLLASLLFRLPA